MNSYKNKCHFFFQTGGGGSARPAGPGPAFGYKVMYMHGNACTCRVQVSDVAYGPFVLVDFG